MWKLVENNDFILNCAKSLAFKNFCGKILYRCT